MGWVSPTGHNDPSEDWVSETNAYDEDTGSNSPHTTKGDSIWSGFLELTHSEIACDKVQFWVEWAAAGVREIDIDIYYDEDWHHVYEGSDFTADEWVEKGFAQVSITAARIRCRVIGVSGYQRLYEFDFNEVEVAVAGRSFGYIIG